VTVKVTFFYGKFLKRKAVNSKGSSSDRHRDHKASYPTQTRAHGGDSAKTVQLPSFNAEVNNVWIFTSTSPIPVCGVTVRRSNNYLKSDFQSVSFFVVVLIKDPISTVINIQYEVTG
jgi:hypothetical protein